MTTQYQQLCELMQWCSVDNYNSTGILEETHLEWDPEDQCFVAWILYESTKLKCKDEDPLLALEGLHILINQTAIKHLAENVELDRLHALEDAQLHALEEAGQ